MTEPRCILRSPSTRRSRAPRRFLPIATVLLALASYRAAAQTDACVGDCSSDRTVQINELILAVRIALGEAGLAECPAIDANRSGAADISELITAVNRGLNGCPATPTPSVATDTPSPEATDTATAQSTPTITGTATPSVTITRSPPPTPTDTPTRTQTSTRTPTPTRTVSSVTPLDLPLDRVRIESFTSENGTQYFVVGVEGQVAAGAQITSLAIGRQPLSLAELGTNSILRRSALTREVLGGLISMGRLSRTRVVRGLPSTQIKLDPGRNPSDGDFDPCANGGAGILYLPGGSRTVSLGGGEDDEPLSLVTAASGEADERVPAAIRKRIRRRMSKVLLDGETLVFPVPAPVHCAGSAVECTDDDQCDTCNQVGQGCCGRASDPPTCSATHLILCDSLDSSSAQCNLEGVCEPGGTVAGQNITLDADIGARVGNPDSQPERPDGFFLRTAQDVVVFIIAPGAERQHFIATAAGFLVDDAALVLGATAERSTVVGAGSTGCGTPVATFTPVPGDTPGTPTVSVPTPSIRERVLAQLHRFPVQVFESADGHVYTVLAGAGGARGIGTQITSLALARGGSVAQLSETAGFDPTDPVLTSVAAVRTGSVVPAFAVRRTALLTGLPSTFVEDLGNPLYGVFDPEANAGSGLLTLPGGTRTVDAFGTGTEPLLSVGEASGGTAQTFVPPARLANVSRRLGREAVFDAPTYVFPFAFEAPITSRGTTCVGGFRDGEACSPEDPAPGDCFEGFGCIDKGGEVPGQNTTLDDTVASRVGNPNSQGILTDGLLLSDTSELIVFVISLGPKDDPLDVAASGFRVTGTCSGAAISCSRDDECGAGTCTAELAARSVVSAATSRPLGGISVQPFVSENGRVYLVVASNPGRPLAVGTQITSLSFGIGRLTQFSETSLRHNPVLTSFSAGNTTIPLNTLQRTALMTGFPSSFIEDMGNPLNGDFDPSANGGDGLLTLPGGARTVTFDGSATEPVGSITTPTGAGNTLVPAAATATLTRAVDFNRFTEVPTVVFPNPPGPVVTSAATTCARNDGPGPVCDPDNGNNDCRSGGMCTNAGGETAGQNVTIDDTVNSRVGNPDSQESAVDGFFLPSNGTTLIVFLVDGLGLAGPLSFSVSGFAVTGTCSNADAPCFVDTDCPSGTCTDGLSQRNVIAATGDVQ